MAQLSIARLVSQDFDKNEFHERCQRVADCIGKGAAALLQGAPRPPSAHPEFAQSKVFYYMCGIKIERSYLLIEGRSGKTTLFVPADGICNVRGGVLQEDAKSAIVKETAIDEILTLEDLEPALAKVAGIYLLQRPDEAIFATKFPLLGAARMRAEDPFDGGKRRDELLAENIKRRFPRIEIGDLDPMICTMRLVKSPAEIDILRKNGKMSAKVCMECMKSTRPGIPKAALHGIADYVFRITGNCGQSYDFILEPSHPESKALVDGDLVLVDCAPDNNCYAMDIGRIWPVNGTFDGWQRHTYGVIVNYHKTLLRILRPGVMVGDLYGIAAGEMLELYKGDKAGTDIVNFMIERGIRYYNHHVGLSAHDAIDRSWRESPLKAGMVIAVDPMVSLPGNPHGCVRVEDTVVITESGCQALTGSAPFEIDEIEKLMQQPGQFPVDLIL